MSKNPMPEDFSKKIHLVRTTIIGLTVFQAIFSVILLIPNLGEFERDTYALPIATLILFFTLGVPKGRNVLILALIGELLVQISQFTSILLWYATDFLSNGMMDGYLISGTFTILLIVIPSAAYLYGRKSLLTFLIITLAAVLVFGLIDQLLLMVANTVENEEFRNIYSEILNLAPIGTAFGLGAGIFNRNTMI